MAADGHGQYRPPGARRPGAGPWQGLEPGISPDEALFGQAADAGGRQPEGQATPPASSDGGAPPPPPDGIPPSTPPDGIPPPDGGEPSRPPDDIPPFAGTAGPADHAGPSRVRPQRADRDERRAQRRKQGSFLRELPVLLLVALVLAFLLRTFVVQVFYIPSSSMEETLSVNDRMVVEKVTYHFRGPERGEVVVFEGEDLGALDPDATVGERVLRGVGQFLGLVPASARDFVKRVIGLPGDEILIEDGQVFVNGVQLDEPYVTYGDSSDFGPVTVPDGSLFFLGDNRPNSSDSRRSLGYVAEDAVVGRSAAIIWPPDHARLLTETRHEVRSPEGENATTSMSDRSAGG